MPNKFPHPDDRSPELEHQLSRLRDQAAELVEQQRASILNRIHRLIGNDARRVTDTEDVLSTTLRRVDRAIIQGTFEAQSDAQFFAFVHRVIERSILEKARASRRLTHRELLAERLKAITTVHKQESRIFSAEKTEQIGKAIKDPIDREIVLLRGRGIKFAMIAETMGMTPFAVRKRWSRIRMTVQQYIEEQDSDDDRQ